MNKRWVVSLLIIGVAVVGGGDLYHPTHTKGNLVSHLLGKGMIPG